MLGYVALMIGSAALFGERPAAMLAIAMPLTMLVLLIAARTTRGGWRWRWGKED